MVQINWGLAQGPNAFDNALAKGYQMGSAMRERQEASERKNALAAYATDPNEQNFAGLAQAAPEFAIGERQRMDAARAQEEARRREQMGTIRQLLVKAGESPEGWAQAMGAAQSLQIDTSTLPQQYDPEWVKKQLFIHDALSDPKTMAGIGAELELAGYQPGTPEFQQAVREVMNGKYAAEYTAPDGTTRRRTILNLQGPGGQQRDLPRVSDEAGYNALPPGAEYIAPDGTPRRKAGGAPQMGAKLTDDQASAIMMRAAQTGTLSASDAEMLAGTLGANGDSAFNQWVRANNIRIGN
jgi:hypothetical protein